MVRNHRQVTCNPRSKSTWGREDFYGREKVEWFKRTSQLLLFLRMYTRMKEVLIRVGMKDILDWSVNINMG